ncbi:MAG: hypothetical protein HY079_01925 [Elusimicrobia bacterium]|nr:hypothetical protein [Elusimicrobiota bacterium]
MGALLAAALSLCALPAAADPTPQVISAVAITAYSSHRQVFRNQYGYWVFFATGSGTGSVPVWTFSQTGEEGTWSALQPIFSGTGQSGFSNQVAAWYHAPLNKIYVAVADANNVQGVPAGGTIHFRSGVLLSTGVAWNQGTHRQPPVQQRSLRPRQRPDQRPGPLRQSGR